MSASVVGTYDVDAACGGIAAQFSSVERAVAVAGGGACGEVLNGGGVVFDDGAEILLTTIFFVFFLGPFWHVEGPCLDEFTLGDNAGLHIFRVIPCHVHVEIFGGRRESIVANAYYGGREHYSDKVFALFKDIAEYVSCAFRLLF